VFEKKLI